jgi:tetratricopeptide (TPR) repeat protein
MGQRSEFSDSEYFLHLAKVWHKFDNDINRPLMPSIIPDFNYDIFISYRQKDNKGERWVSEFVEALKTELESTFKEEISIYFDINPHDGLLETHDVGASLKEKLRCLVFIPIISRTYCDPRSFAWEHEFKAFVEQASQDQFGLKVKLPNGNVASRVLPIRIHDLDNADIKLCETVIGGMLRGVDFIYKSAGVNRPLRLKEEKPQDNLNDTLYRDQINKVANSISEIIHGISIKPFQTLKGMDHAEETNNEVRGKQRKTGPEKSVRSAKRTWLYITFIATLILIAAILAYPKIFKRDKPESVKSSEGQISIAVLPFQNMTNDTVWNVWQDGIQANLITSLSNSSEDFKVRQTESISSILQSKGFTNYASITPSVASMVSRKLDANIYVDGNINQSGAIIRLNAKVIDSKSKVVLKSFQVDGLAEKILPLTDSLAQMVKDFLIFSKLKKELPSVSSHELTTNSPEAFRYYICGRNEFMKADFPAARNWYLQALSIDSNFIDAITGISLSYGNEFIASQAIKSEASEFLFEQARLYCIKAYKKRDQMPIKERIYANWIYSLYFESPREEIIHQKQLLNLDDQDPTIYYNLGYTYFRLFQYDKAIPEYEKALEIYKKWGSKPGWVHNYTFLGEAYRITGQFKKAKKLYRKAWGDFRGDPNLIFHMTILLLSNENTRMADRLVKIGVSYMRKMPMSEASIASILASGYTDAGLTYKAEEYYRQALSLEPENPVRLNDLAYFLINKDLNTKEGLELIDKAMELEPENYLYLHTKGWGLFKQGNNKDAFDILQKSWDLRRTKASYDHEAYLHLEEVKQAITAQQVN